MPSKRSKRSRRKAKQGRAHDTVDVVLEAAAQVLLKRGYASATTNRIAEAAGVSVGTVYEYFANKDEVFDALIQRELAALVVAIRSQALPADAPVYETLGRILSVAMQAARFGPELFRALQQVPGATFHRRLGRARTVVIGYVKDVLERHRPELAVGDLDLAAFILVSAAEGVGTNATREMFDDRLRVELTALFRGYLIQP